MPGHQETSLMMTEIFDPAAHRKPVDVHVAQRHEHGHEQAPVVEIFVFGHLFDHDDRTVGRSEYGLRILDSYAGRRTEKRSDEQDEQRSGTGHDPSSGRSHAQTVVMKTANAIVTKMMEYPSL